MKRVLSYLLVALLFTISCSRHKGDAIPRGDLAQIYAEMFLADAAIKESGRSMRTVADTSRVYAAIFGKYGYTVEDYLASQEQYIQDARRYTRILKQAVNILEKENRVLKKELEIQQDMKNRMQNILRFIPNRIMLLDTLDSVSCFTLDSLAAFDFLEGLDTTYRGPRMIVWADTIKVKVDSAEVQ